MRRREFIKAVTATLLAGGWASEALAHTFSMDEPYAEIPGDYGGYLDDYLGKMRNFNRAHPADVFVTQGQMSVFKSCLERMERLEATAGHGKFHLLDFDEARTIAHDYPRVGEFPATEIAFLEEIFYADAKRYGFYGEKLMTKVTDRIPMSEVVKIPLSGHYLYKGRPLATYDNIRRDVGDRVILTSGVRGVMKQFQLFMRKASENSGNLSLASRSLAPPGFSFHGISDFDVGQVRFGSDNFTERFTTTDVYRKLNGLDYVSLRYPRDNLLGVRFEPWHIKV